MKVMTAIAAEVNLSELLNKPRATLSLLESNRRVYLRRRDAADLVLTTAERAAEDDEVVSTTSRVFNEMMRHDPAVLTMTVTVMPAVFPWVRHLTEKGKQEFAAEWLAALSAAASMGNNAALAGLIAAWRHTAEIQSDPELFATLTTPHDDDYGPAIMPGLPG
jgi:hypothetical protein